MHRSSPLCGLDVGAASSTPALAPDCVDLVEGEARHRSETATFVAATKGANALNAGMADDGPALKPEWINASRENGARPQGIVADSALAHLQTLLDHSDGRGTEVIATDPPGMPLALRGVRSDSCQGDKSTFQQAYAFGADAVRLSKIEFDAPTRPRAFFTQVDPAMKEYSGALTVGLTAQLF